MITYGRCSSKEHYASSVSTSIAVGVAFRVQPVQVLAGGPQGGLGLVQLGLQPSPALGGLLSLLGQSALLGVRDLEPGGVLGGGLSNWVRRFVSRWEQLWRGVPWSVRMNPGVREELPFSPGNWEKSSPSLRAWGRSRNCCG
ncbi:hypothetical protein [Nonomuraea sp. NPDC049028]|uniref:hypothetical protein n=1 Tax=Nonomuraea sp. NPDC049028 TaxID=3364348 RepID=UPI003710D060